jgi:hypothetical protein
MNYNYKVWLHLAFWLLFSTVPRLISPPAFQIGLLFMVTLVIDVCNFYAFYVFVIPDFFIKRKIGKPIPDWCRLVCWFHSIAYWDF